MVVKYRITADLTVWGLVTENDVVGAMYGELEGLLGEHTSLKKLQKGGEISRFMVELRPRERGINRTIGTVTVLSSMDRESTAVLAAAFHEVERIGPCAAEVVVALPVDVRAEKRARIAERGAAMLSRWDAESPGVPAGESPADMPTAAAPGGDPAAEVPAGPLAAAAPADGPVAAVRKGRQARGKRRKKGRGRRKGR